MAHDYLDRVVQAYQGEAFGEAIFEELARRSDDAETSDKWKALAQLERETKERLMPLVASLGGDVRVSPDSYPGGKQLAERWERQTFDELMLEFKNTISEYVAFFECLEKDARPEDRGVLAAVAAHERAIQAFAEREVAGHRETSLEPVLALLDRPPQRGD